MRKNIFKYTSQPSYAGLKKKTYKPGDRIICGAGGTKHLSTRECCFAAIKDMRKEFNATGNSKDKFCLSYVRLNPVTFCNEILNKPIVLNINF